MQRKSLMLSALCGSLWFSSVGWAAPEDEEKPSKKAARAESRERVADDQERGRRQPPGEQKRPDGRPEGRPDMRPGRRDLTHMIPVMMEKFDRDGDEKLDVEELTALLSFMRERQAQMGGNRGEGMMPGKRPRPGARPGENGPGGRGRPGADGNQEAGGVKPRRPPAE